MGLFSKRVEEPSHSRAWITQNGELARKAQLAFAIVARLARVPEGQEGAWGASLDDGGLIVAHGEFAGAVRQDISLARHVARDLALMFEANGGLTVAHADAFASIGLDPSKPLRPGFGSTGEGVGGTAVAVARAIQARSEGGEAARPTLPSTPASSRTSRPRLVSGAWISARGRHSSSRAWRAPSD